MPDVWLLIVVALLVVAIMAVVEHGDPPADEPPTLNTRGDE